MENGTVVTDASDDYWSAFSIFRDASSSVSALGVRTGSTILPDEPRWARLGFEPEEHRRSPTNEERARYLEGSERAHR